MIENLKTTRFNYGTPVPNATDEYEWDNLSAPANCWYNNDIANALKTDFVHLISYSFLKERKECSMVLSWVGFIE